MDGNLFADDEGVCWADLSETLLADTGGAEGSGTQIAEPVLADAGQSSQSQRRSTVRADRHRRRKRRARAAATLANCGGDPMAAACAIAAAADPLAIAADPLAAADAATAPPKFGNVVIENALHQMVGDLTEMTETAQSSIEEKRYERHKQACLTAIGAIRAADRQVPMTGTVKCFSKETGWGFITPDDGTEDIMVRRSVYADGTDRDAYLVEGQQVEYDIAWMEQNRKYTCSACTGWFPADAAGHAPR